MLEIVFKQLKNEFWIRGKCEIQKLRNEDKNMRVGNKRKNWHWCVTDSYRFIVFMSAADWEMYPPSAMDIISPLSYLYRLKKHVYTVDNI